MAGVLLVFIPLMGDYITATVLGGAKGNMVGQLVASQFQTAQNWALGSAMAVVLMLVIALTIAVAAAIIWLIALPFRRRTRLVLGDAPAAAEERSEHHRHRAHAPDPRRSTPAAAGVGSARGATSR